ncbi:isoleucine-tRNA ligase [Acanthamoeba castellanii str. Neff]|uniref:isoleucine--tRNA ligase n=1 Tax=Acanthamoeba castellanii (strain ATCC 30010 / Neff) TaxID=1257118 RepID=L8GKW1_ACACF|nr:isoleucine-tRNA ligase [Acanthamoeba castellanii str. Neff]ELR12836.1 isoleucine-tRNA ligase [Acanthamoeba castellanii str. Neff]
MLRRVTNKGLASEANSAAAAPAATANSKAFGHTLNLPRTTFPLYTTEKAQLQLEGSLLAEVSDNLYAWQAQQQRQKSFVLHDGPPYANGPLHTGHVMNKVLKDIVNRYKLLRGHAIKYVPGWDCHGLPIELKAVDQAKSGSTLSPTEIRAKAHACAEEAIAQQMKGFRSWGVMGEWNNPYATKDPKYEASQLGLFLDLYKKGYVYRGLKPVIWSPSSRTALAEAEVEYSDTHVSPSVYVAFSVKHLANKAGELSRFNNLHALIWTTTPWTIPANMAICVNPNIEYSVVKTTDQHDKHYVIASDRLQAMQELLKQEIEVCARLPGSSLADTIYVHPLDGRELKVLPGTHVTTESGTGLVHTAPAHGADDYVVCKAHGIPLRSFVDDNGKFTQDLPEFAGKFVLGPGNELVIQALTDKGALVHQHKYTHKYPYDWRTKKPIIMRATEQWFVDLKDVVAPALDEISRVQMVPATGRTRLESFIRSRQEWCISRQRVWGLPIPVFYSRQGELLLTEESVGHVQKLVAKHGSDCWWSMPTSELLPPSEKHNADKWEKGRDTMDVWLDSGVSWHSVLHNRELPFPADMYLEGSDQHRGWFQSSLITSVALTGKAPYRAVLTHGFVLDEHGRKMSKSLGNTIDPVALVNGDEKKAGCGVDVLRMWVASSDYSRDTLIGPVVINKMKGSLRKLRNTARFLLGNLADYDRRQAIPDDDLTGIDRYMLHKLHEFSHGVTTDYDDYQFSKVYRGLVNFATVDLSAFYFEVVKDRLYADATDSLRRRSTQTVLRHTLDALTAALAPIAPFTAQDIHRHDAQAAAVAPNVFHLEWPRAGDQWKQDGMAQQWDAIRDVRSQTYKVLEAARAHKVIGSSLDARVRLYTGSDDNQVARWLAEPTSDELAEILVTSAVDLVPEAPAFEVVDDRPPQADLTSGPTPSFVGGGLVHAVPVGVEVVPASMHAVKCPRCWRYASAEENTPCPRCAQAMA